VPNDVASSVFHGSCPMSPSTTHAPQSITSPSCFNARYGPAGLSVESALRAKGALDARRAIYFSGREARLWFRSAQPLKKKAAEAAFSARGTGQGWRPHCRAFSRRRSQALAAADLAAVDFVAVLATAALAAGLATAGVGAAGLAA